MIWEQFQQILLFRDKPGLANRMYNCLSAKGIAISGCLVEETEVGGKAYWVATTRQGRRFFWNHHTSNWITPREVDPSSAFQNRVNIEKKLGVQMVMNRGDLTDHFFNLLENVQQLTVTGANLLLSTEPDERGHLDFEQVGLVSVEPLSSAEVREWESACRRIVEEDEAA